MDHILITSSRTHGLPTRDSGSVRFVAPSRAEIAPVNIGPELLTGHRTGDLPFDSRTVLGRNPPPNNPVMHRLWRHTNCPREGTLPTAMFNSFVQRIHSGQIKHVGIICQHVVFHSLNTCCSFPA